MPHTLVLLSAAAKSRGVGGAIGNGISSAIDNWDAPGIVKATMAFYIIFAIAYLLQLVLVIQRMGKLPNFNARIPFIIGAVVLFILIIIEIISAVAIRIQEDITYKVYDDLWSTNSFLLSIEIGFRPAAFLLLVHQRGKLLRKAQNKAANPIASQFWKRILDWALVAIGCLVYLTYFAIYTNENLNVTKLSETAFETYYKALEGFSHMITVMIILLAIDVFVSLLLLYLSGNRVKCSDPMIGKLLFIASPAFFAFALESLIFDIYFTDAAKKPDVVNSQGYLGAEFAQVILDNVCRIVIFGALVSVMDLPAAPWANAPIGNPNYAAPNMGNAGYPSQLQGWQYQQQPYANPNMPHQYGQQYPQQYSQPYSIPTSIQTSAVPA